MPVMMTKGRRKRNGKSVVGEGVAIEMFKLGCKRKGQKGARKLGEWVGDKVKRTDKVGTRRVQKKMGARKGESSKRKHGENI